MAQCSADIQYYDQVDDCGKHTLIHRIRVGLMLIVVRIHVRRKKASMRHPDLIQRGV